VKNEKMRNIENLAINETAAVEHLKIFFPFIQDEIAQLSVQNNFAGIIQATVNYMKSLLQQSKLNIVNRNIKMMDWLYRNGTNNVQQIIENLFVRSFRSFKKSYPHQWSLLYLVMPHGFQRIYMKQTKMDKVLFRRH